MVRRILSKILRTLVVGVVLALVLAVSPISAQTPTETAVNIAARRSGKTSEVCVTNSAGGTTFTSFAARKAIEFQNLGPNSIFCTVDSQAPLATGALGRRILTGGASTRARM
jgi:galactitol-specific phosphotransferase system IIC component